MSKWRFCCCCCCFFLLFFQLNNLSRDLSLNGISVDARNLRRCPTACKKTAYLDLVRPLLEYGAIIWEPYQKQDISKKERIQCNAVRFITRDYKSKTPGSVTSLLTKYDLPTLQERREDLRLTFLYKVVGGLVPAIPPEKYLTPQKASRNIRPPNRPDYIVQNPVHNQSRNHDRCLEIPSYSTELYKQSFYPRTIIAWNKLNTSIVQASSLKAFKSAPAVARRRWGAPTPRTQPRRNLRQTTDITMRRKTLWRL